MLVNMHKIISNQAKNKKIAQNPVLGHLALVSARTKFLKTLIPCTTYSIPRPYEIKSRKYWIIFPRKPFLERLLVVYLLP